MRIEQIGDWTLEDRLALGGKPVVVRFFETGDKNDAAARRDFQRGAKAHPNARFYEVDVVENPSLVAKHRIGRAPMVLVFIDGVEVARQSGSLLAVAVHKALGGETPSGDAGS